jgi:hypothetical protein
MNQKDLLEKIQSARDTLVDDNESPVGNCEKAWHILDSACRALTDPRLSHDFYCTSHNGEPCNCSLTTPQPEASDMEIVENLNRIAKEISEEWECDDDRLDNPTEIGNLSMAVIAAQTAYIAGHDATIRADERREERERCVSIVSKWYDEEEYDDDGLMDAIMEEGKPT